MRTHSQIIKDAGGVAVVATAVRVSPNTVKQWARLSSIPAPYWRVVADHGFATLDELADDAAAKARASLMPANDPTTTEAAA